MKPSVPRPSLSDRCDFEEHSSDDERASHLTHSRECERSRSDDPMWRCRHIEWPESSQAEGTAEREGGTGSQTGRGRRTECRLDRVPNARSCLRSARVDDMRHSAACEVSFPHRGRLRRTSALRRDGRVTLFGEGWVTGHRSSCGIGGVDMTHAYLTASLTGVPEVVELGVR